MNWLSNSWTDSSNKTLFLKKKYQQNENEEKQEVSLSELSSDDFETAPLMAKANKEVTINNEECYVTYIDSLANTNLKVQDNIIEYKAWNSAIENSVPASKKRYYFFKAFGKHSKFSELVKYIDKDRLHIRIIRKLKKILIK